MMKEVVGENPEVVIGQDMFCGYGNPFAVYTSCIHRDPSAPLPRCPDAPMPQSLNLEYYDRRKTIILNMVLSLQQFTP